MRRGSRRYRGFPVSLRPACPQLGGDAPAREPSRCRHPRRSLTVSAPGKVINDRRPAVAGGKRAGLIARRPAPSRDCTARRSPSVVAAVTGPAPTRIASTTTRPPGAQGRRVAVTIRRDLVRLSEELDLAGSPRSSPTSTRRSSSVQRRWRRTPALGWDRARHSRLHSLRLMKGYTGRLKGQEQRG